MRNVFFVFSLLALFACRHEEYPGFSRTESGVYYQLTAIGETEAKALPGDYITVDLKYKTMADSVFFAGRRRLQVEPSQFDGSVDECFTMLSAGDGATFILSADDFFGKTLQTSVPAFFGETRLLKVDISVLEIQTEQDYNREREAFLKWIEDFDEYEKVLVKQYVEQNKIDALPDTNGIYHIVLAQGKGTEARRGDTVVVHYEGRFLNGRFFDSTKKRNEPFTFILGQEYQVIEGMEDAIGMMCEGEKALFILPSGTAFGRSGSSTGIIPPYTSLIYEVELLDIKN